MDIGGITPENVGGLSPADQLNADSKVFSEKHDKVPEKPNMESANMLSKEQKTALMKGLNSSIFGRTL